MTIALDIPEISLGARKFQIGHTTLAMPLLKCFFLRMLRLDTAYLCAKFDISSFSHSRDMVCAHQNLNGSRDQTTPLSGKVCRAINRLPNLKTLSLPTMKIWKEIQNVENGEVSGQSSSMKIAPFDRAHRSTY